MDRIPRVKRTVATMLQALASGEPRTRKELIDPLRPEGRSQSWGCAYFSRARITDRPHLYRSYRDLGVERASLYLRGMIVPVGKVRNAELWTITPKGLEALALARSRGVV